MILYLNSWEYTLCSAFWTEIVSLFSWSLKLALELSSHTVFQHRDLTRLIRKSSAEIGQLYLVCLRKHPLLSLMPCTDSPCKPQCSLSTVQAAGDPVLLFCCFGLVFFSVKVLLESRWCFVHHCTWTLWSSVRGLTAFGFANVLVFKPLLNYCMALFDSPLLSVYCFEKGKKEEKECLYWTAPFHLLDISLSVLCVRDYFRLLAEALNGPVAS